MTYNMNNYVSTNGLGMPGAGFASRGKSNRPQRLSLASPPKVGSISENPNANLLNNPPRTSRSHLLAGLRTQPKTPGAVPASAPYNKTSHGQYPYGSSALPQYQQSNAGYGNVPHTAIGSNFPSMGRQQQLSMNPGQQFYSLPEQVLAPPPLELDETDEQIDPQLAQQLLATRVYLQERQQQLQQLALAQQLGGMNLNAQANRMAHSSYPQTPITPQQLNMFAQPQVQPQMQNHGNGIFTQEVVGQPGVYVVYNALTGISTLAVDTSSQQMQPGAELANSPPPPTPSRINTKFHDHTGSYDTGSPFGSRSRSPPKKSSSPPQDVTPLPPPSANAFRRGHGRNRSSLVVNSMNGGQVSDGPKSAIPRTVGMPATPMTGTFGPGHQRAGEHPMRQPMGPPSYDELKKAPTSKHEGSKNFATRQRRKALSTLVRAGLERRVRPGSGSAGSMTPVSDTEVTFSVPSDNDSDSGRSLSGRLSIGSLRAAASGVIGSGRKNRSQESIGSGIETPNSSTTEAPLKTQQSNVLVGLGAA